MAAVRLSAVEAVRAGTTSVLDHHYACTDAASTIAVADAVAEVGIRARIGRGMVGPITPEAESQGLGHELFRYSTSEELEIMRMCLEERPPGGLVEVWPAPLDVIYTPFDLIGGAVELAREFGTGWHAHCSEVAKDPELFEAAHGVRPVSWLFDEGLLGHGATLAHAIWLDDDEIDQLGQTRSGVAHNPVCNMYMSSAPTLPTWATAKTSLSRRSRPSCCSASQRWMPRRSRPALRSSWQPEEEPPPWGSTLDPWSRVGSPTSSLWM